MFTRLMATSCPSVSCPSSTMDAPNHKSPALAERFTNWLYCVVDSRNV